MYKISKKKKDQNEYSNGIILLFVQNLSTPWSP